eukprot:scaffold1053_cov107-Isochrysis_galbana.AAC.4
MAMTTNGNGHKITRGLPASGLSARSASVFPAVVLRAPALLLPAGWRPRSPAPLPTGMHMHKIMRPALVKASYIPSAAHPLHPASSHQALLASS